MHFILLATVVLTFVYFSIAGPIVRSVPETNEAASATGIPFETPSSVPRDLQERSNGFDDNPFSVITLLPSLIYPEGTTGVSFLVFNPEPTEQSSAAEQTHRSPSSTTITTSTSRLTAGIIRPLTDFTSKPASTQGTKTNPNPSESTQTQSSKSRPVGSIVPFTKPEDQTTSRVNPTSGFSSSSTEFALTTTAAIHSTTASEKTTTVHATSTATATAVVTMTNPVTSFNTTTVTTTATVTVTAATTTTKKSTKTETETETVTKTKTMTQCSNNSATTSSSYNPTGVDVIPVHPTWLTTSEPSTTDDAAITSYSPTGVDVIPVHPTWATGI